MILSNANRMNVPSVQQGASLLEVMIAVVVLSVGLLGVAALQGSALQTTHSSLMRSQATTLAADMADRLRANRNQAISGAYDTDFVEAVECAAPTSTGTLPAQELEDWQIRLACGLPSGQGRIERSGNQITITTRWDISGLGFDEAFEEFTTRTEL